jgi:hypothetical protein
MTSDDYREFFYMVLPQVQMLNTKFGQTLKAFLPHAYHKIHALFLRSAFQFEHDFVLRLLMPNDRVYNAYSRSFVEFVWLRRVAVSLYKNILLSRPVNLLKHGVY